MRFRLLQAISRFNIALGSVSGFATGLMMCVIVIDVAGRACFSSPLPLATEISVLLLIIKIFLGMAGAQATDSNFQVTLVIDLLSPRWRRYQRVFSLVVTLAAVAIITWLSIGYAITSTRQGESSFGVYPFPIWPERIILAAGLVFLVLQLVTDLIVTTLGGDEALKAGLPKHDASV
ncbi:TRAP-type mannitol/chloroaromatic compound transport system, small permease component [Tistlia consotensis]|uniref:TRAP transporter small permease protein n=1 Tax=Tistlia consotensis USBA 355 TaxID=560819 RepID=A0A1Y6C4S6_9PROT|nr:TRAP transporter small permease [Tistlia consotensis]SMF36841.1 TRAP-type mannitol/chloroaromatic compound transport system, small permease component [Tistlia consotensis USBA 355]SNR72183.1 TRAP-type mannitol/chloroaromatic compound transport system, small permease component [Tistlia consotensis]